MTFSPDHAVQLSSLQEATREAGFEVEWAELEATGTLVPTRVQGREAPGLRLRSRDQTVAFLPGDRPRTRRNHAALSRRMGDAPELEVRGRIHTHPGGRLAMTVRRFEGTRGSSR